ncbi:RDD family protein [Rhizobium etli]|uniref:RDD family protein n=1 Tax=Rhizobium etli TaxID=29449 RepID=UPI00038394D5|nr:RDD family protein [Rhizobium etli]AGS20617.1 RDD domain-containing protein [Rhizobium etli bv. mimosae str. Mim1]
MDVNIAHSSQRALQPRLFWRRAFAFLIDMTIFEMLLAAVALVIPLNFGMPLFQSTHCGEVTSGPLVEKVEREWPLKPGETRVNQICQITDFLGPQSTSFRTTVVTSNPDGGSASWRTVSVGLDKNGDPIEGLEDPIGPLVGVLLASLAFALFNANDRRTPGKRILAIRVVTVEGASPQFGKALNRELLKFAPWIAFVGVDTIEAATASHQSLDAMIQTMRNGDAPTTIPVLISVVLAVFALLWWFLPLIRWRGQMLYDRFAGCGVRRT